MEKGAKLAWKEKNKSIARKTIDQTLIEHPLFDRDSSRLWIRNYQWTSTLFSGLMGFPLIPGERMTEDSSVCVCVCVCVCVHMCARIYMHVFVCVWESKDIPLKKWCLSQDLKEVDEQSPQFNLASLSVLLLQNKTEIRVFDLSFSYYLMVACQRYNSNFKRR